MSRSLIRLMNWRSIGKVIKSAATDFIEDDAMSLAAALSFYAALSLAPLLVLMISIAGVMGEDTQAGIVRQITSQVSPEAAEGVKMVIDNAQQNPRGGIWSSVIGGAILLFGAATVFAQLQFSLNRIWEIEVTAGGTKGLWLWIRKRLLCFGMILAIAFLLMLSLALSTALPMLLSAWGVSLPWLDFLITLASHILLFGLIYKILPDAKIGWSEVWVGATMTALLFALGKLAISQYLAYAGVGSAYGTAGSLVVLLVWVYYSSVVFFFGAELTQSYTRAVGGRIEPMPYAANIPSRRVSTGA